MRIIPVRSLRIQSIRSIGSIGPLLASFALVLTPLMAFGQKAGSSGQSAGQANAQSQSTNQETGQSQSASQATGQSTETSYPGRKGQAGPPSVTGRSPMTDTKTSDSSKDLASAQAQLQSKNGTKTEGVVHFTETPSGLNVHYTITGLQPNSVHGFHIHEKGDCASPDASTAGKHFAPIAKTGGTAKDSPQKHAGDLPQIKADATGKAEGSFEVSHLSIDEKFAIENRAIIVHAGPDDPSKPSPRRIACGLIKPMGEQVSAVE